MSQIKDKAIFSVLKKKAPGTVAIFDKGVIVFIKFIYFFFRIIIDATVKMPYLLQTIFSLVM